MTTTRRTALLLAVVVALSSVTAVWAFAGTSVLAQEETDDGPSVRVDSLDAPVSVEQGETVTVTAVVSLPAEATESSTDDGTATENGTATDGGTETAMGTDIAAGTETPTG